MLCKYHCPLLGREQGQQSSLLGFMQLRPVVVQLEVLISFSKAAQLRFSWRLAAAENSWLERPLPAF